MGHKMTFRRFWKAAFVAAVILKPWWADLYSGWSREMNVQFVSSILSLSLEHNFLVSCFRTLSCLAQYIV